MNHRELAVKDKYEAQGYRVLRGGAPDFVCLKVEKGKVTAVVFVEVKSPSDQLSYEQATWREIARFLGVPFVTEVIE